jgi:hypothetical protein
MDFPNLFLLVFQRVNNYLNKNPGIWLSHRHRWYGRSLVLLRYLSFSVTIQHPAEPRHYYQGTIAHPAEHAEKLPLSYVISIPNPFQSSFRPYPQPPHYGPVFLPLFPASALVRKKGASAQDELEFCLRSLLDTDGLLPACPLFADVFWNLSNR